jgi:hypothetical protein
MLFDSTMPSELILLVFHRISRAQEKELVGGANQMSRVVPAWIFGEIPGVIGLNPFHEIIQSGMRSSLYTPSGQTALYWQHHRYRYFQKMPVPPAALAS